MQSLSVLGLIRWVALGVMALGAVGSWDLAASWVCLALVISLPLTRCLGLGASSATLVLWARTPVPLLVGLGDSVGWAGVVLPELDLMACTALVDFRSLVLSALYEVSLVRLREWSMGSVVWAMSASCAF